MTTVVQYPASELKTQAVMPDGFFADLQLSDCLGKYTLLFFYPLDFIFVCPTDIIACSDQVEDFEANGEVYPSNWPQGVKTIKPTPEDSRHFFREQQINLAT